MAICLTSGCAVAAVELIRDMSPDYQNIDPCEDFRSYVCEGFDMSHEMRADQARVSTFSVLSENAESVLHQVLESPISELAIDSPAAKANFEKIHSAYSACMNETELAAKGNEPLLELIAVLDVPYPQSVVHDSDAFAQEPLTKKRQNDAGLTEALQYLMNVDVSALISLGVGVDDKDPSQQVIGLGAPPLGLPSKRSYKQPNLLKLYSQTMAKVFSQLSSSDSKSEATLRVQQMLSKYNVSAIVELEQKIAAAKADPEDRNDPDKRYNPMNSTDVDKLLPQISVSSLIKRHAPDLLSTKIIVSEPDYLDSLRKILQETSGETVRAYLIWNLIRSYGIYVVSDASKTLGAFSNMLNGRDPDASEERWRTCVRHVDSGYAPDHGLGWILTHYYINETFSQNSTSFGNRVILDIKDRFIQKLKSSSWMTPSVRDLAIAKVRGIRQKIGYPTKSPDVTNSDVLRDYYASVEISPNDYFSNAISLATFGITKEWAEAGKKPDKDAWGMTSPTVNAYYNPVLSEIVFPAGIMQRPIFYDPSIPRYLSYGAFGAVGGHELSHAFDSSGAKYDIEGRLREWWDEDTLRAFKNKTECWIGQYDQYTVPDVDGGVLHVNGRLTQGENIADAGGASAAFQAWKKRQEESGREDELLPGLLEFSREQLFFVSYANLWCEKARVEANVNQVLTNEHSPAGVRILGTMANSREFREAFNCPVKEPTCELW